MNSPRLDITPSGLNVMSPLSLVASPHFPAAQLPRMAASAIRTFIDTASPAVFSSHDIADTGRLLTPADLRHAFQDDSVTVSVIHGGAFRPQAGGTRYGSRMLFRDFATYAESSNRQNSETLYLSQFPLDTAPLILRPDVAAPPYTPNDSVPISKNIWFGPAGTISPFHFDRSHNLLHQHWGRKHVVMFDPSHYHLMKPGSKNSGSAHVCSLDVVTADFKIDLSRFNAPCFETILEPGDVLFIPAFWWHHVTSIDVAISINYWWRPPLNACLYPNFFRLVSSTNVYHDPSVVTQWVDVTPHKLDTALCLFLADEGHTFGAAALAGAIVTAFFFNALRMLGISEVRHPTREVETDTLTLPNFAEAVTLIPVLTDQALITSSQSTLLIKWLELAEETAREPESVLYTSERSTAIRHMIWQLHTELGRCLSM